MAPEDLPYNVRKYIFDHIDSVEQLEVLLFLRDQRENSLSASEIATNLRINPKSVANRLTNLLTLNLITQDSEKTGAYRYAPATPELANLIQDLSDEYKIRKHRVLEAIFSPAKRARQFAAAFTLAKKTGQENGDENG